MVSVPFLGAKNVRNSPSLSVASFTFSYSIELLTFSRFVLVLKSLTLEVETLEKAVP